MSIKKIYHMSTMVSYYAVEGVDVVHVLYNLNSMSLEKSLVCVLILKLGQHCLCLCLPVTLIRQTQRVYTVHMFRGSNHGTIILY